MKATLAALLILTAVAAHAEVEVVAVGGDPAPDGNGTFVDFGIPSMNRLGQVAFVATLNGTTGDVDDDTGIFRGTGARGSLGMIVRRGDPSPDANGTFALLDSGSAPVINDSGQVAFIAGLSGTVGGESDNTGIFRGDGTPSGLTQILRQGAALPGGGTVPNLRGSGLIGTFAFNEMGQVAFTGGAKGTFRIFGDAVIPIAGFGHPLPDGSGMFGILSVPVLNDVGQVAFADSSLGIFRGNGSTLLEIVRPGDPSPDGNGNFIAPFGPPAMNNRGDVAFFGNLTSTSGSTSDNQGIFIRRADALMTIVRRGQAAPGGNGRFLDLISLDNVAINEVGQTAFLATLPGTSGGTIDYGLFRADETTLTQIVRTGDSAPDGSTIALFGRPALNNAGQVAFVADLVPANGTSAPRAIFLYDDQVGLRQVVRAGDPLLGSKIAVGFTLAMPASTTFNGRHRSGLNEQGRIVFRFDLDDGRRGIAIAGPFYTPGTETPTPSPAPTITETSGPPITPTPTNTPGGCTGDCDGNDSVAVNELVQLLSFALGTNPDCSRCRNGLPRSVTCPSGVTVSVIIQGVNHARTGCAMVGRS
jgi:hypothetical protein